MGRLLQFCAHDSDHRGIGGAKCMFSLSPLGGLLLRAGGSLSTPTSSVPALTHDTVAYRQVAYPWVPEPVQDSEAE